MFLFCLFVLIEETCVLDLNSIAKSSTLIIHMHTKSFTKTPQWFVVIHMSNAQSKS